MHAPQHCITPRDHLVVSVSRLRIETFLDRCRVAVGLTVPWVLCLGHNLGVITQSHSQTVQHTLDTANVILGPHVLSLLSWAISCHTCHNLSMALASDGDFVCNLLIISVIEPSSSRVQLANCGMRDASSRSSSVSFTVNLSSTTLLSQRLSDVPLVLTAAFVVNEFLVVAVRCNNTLGTELTIVSR